MAIGTPVVVLTVAQQTVAATSVNLAVTATAAANTLCVLSISKANSDITSVTDSQGNTWTQDLAANDGTRFATIYSSQLATQLTTSDTITPHFSNSTSGLAQYSAVTITGLATSSAKDKTASGSATSTNPTTGATATLSQANEIGIAMVRSAGSISGMAAGFTSVDGTTLSYGYKIVAATTALTAAWTAASASWVALLATYKAPGGSPPVNTVAPAVTGTTAVGSVLTTTNGTWTDAGSPAFTYQWQRDVAGNGSYSNIGSATSSTYTLVDADDGNKVRCNVTDTDANGATAAASNAVGLITEPIPVNTVAPAVTGTTTVGQTLTTTNGTWTHQGGSVATYAYQWKRDAQGSGSYSNISSATSTTYALVDADDGCHIKCSVTATNTGGTAAATDSNIVGTVIEPVPTNSVAPVISGTAQVGQTVSSTTGTWTHQAGTVATYAYQWQDSANGSTGWANIASATSSSYLIASGELTKYLRCNVTATNTGGAGSAASSNVLGPNIAAASIPESSPIPFLLFFH